MKVKFTISRPLRNAAGLKDFKQPAKLWLATLFQSLADQLEGDGNGTIGMEIDGVRFEFRVVKIPGIIDTREIRISAPKAQHPTSP